MQGTRFFQTIQVRLIIIYVLLILIAMQVIGVYFVKTMESTFKKNFTDSLHKQAYLLAEYVEPYLSANQEGKQDEERKTYEDLSEVVSNLFSISNGEIQIIDANGTVRVISSSQQQRKILLNQKNTQKEVSQALEGIRDIEHEMDLDGEPRKVIAQPVSSGSKVIGAVYISASMEEMYETLNRVNKIFISGTMIALVLTALLGVMLAHTITNPIKEITKQATAMAEGNFNQVVQVTGRDEIGQLGSAFNYMTNRLKEALSVNEEEKEKLASILSNMSDGVVATNDQGKVILMNRRARQMLQVKDGNMEYRDMYQLLGMSRDTVEKFSQAEDNKALIQVQSVEEEELVIRVMFTPIHRRGKGITGTIAVLQDVTEQEKLELSRREFVANVSHELRTPLTTIKSYIEALEDGALEEPQLAQRFTGVVRNETERMIRLVTDLLHLSRLDSNEERLSKELTELDEMLEEVADRFSFQMRQKEIEIEIDVEDGLGPVMLDRDQIDQVLDNLVSNAIKYTGNGGIVCIRAAKQEKDWVRISVEDTGMGIPKKDLSRIFERFYRVDKARSRNMGGTGLGLSIAREIIRAHGGSITLESELHRGTSVHFTLPVMQQEGEVLT